MQQTGDFEYYVVFSDNNVLPAPWRWFCKKGFRHCSIYMNLGGRITTMEQSLYGIKVYQWLETDYQDIDHLLKDIVSLLKNYKALHLRVKADKIYKNKLGTLLPTCVSLCQRITGVASHNITPYGYYKYLLKNGAIEMVSGSKLDKQALAEQKAENAKLKAKDEVERERLLDLKKRQRFGRKSLLGTEGDELGVS